MASRGTGTIERYYLSYNLCAFSSGLVGVFLNLYFLSNYNYLAVLDFQLATYATAFTAYALSGYALRRYSPKHLYILGLVISGLVLLDLLVVTGPLSNAFAFGILWGAAMGVFYAGNNPMMHDITRGENRTSFVAVNNLFTAAASLVAPVCAGALIQFSTFSGVERYLWDFAVACGVFLVAALVIRQVRYDSPRVSGYSVPRIVRGPGRGYRRFQSIFVATQLFGIPIGIVLPIYVFEQSGSYLITGSSRVTSSSFRSSRTSRSAEGSVRRAGSPSGPSSGSPLPLSFSSFRARPFSARSPSAASTRSSPRPSTTS